MGSEAWGPTLGSNQCRTEWRANDRGTAVSDESGCVRLSGAASAELADQPTCFGAVEHHRRGLPVFVGAEPEERWRSSRVYVRPVMVGVDDERRAECGGERGEGASCLRALFERARVVAEEEVDLAAPGEALKCGTLARDGAMPVATSSTRSDRKRTAVGKAAEVAEA